MVSTSLITKKQNERCQHDHFQLQSLKFDVNLIIIE